MPTVPLQTVPTLAVWFVALLLKQVGMCSGADKHHGTSRPCIVEPVDEQDVAADVAPPICRPFALQPAIFPLGTKRSIVGD